MFTHLLIATDGSNLAEKALVQGIDLAKELGAKVSIVTVTDPLPSALSGDATSGFPVEYYTTAARTHAAKILRRGASVARQKGVPCETVYVSDYFPAEGIVETARAMGCDLIVMASHGRRGLAKLFLGSEATKVLSSSTLSVLICK